MEFVFYMMLDAYYYLNAIFSVLFDLDVWTMATLVAFGTIKPPIVDYKGKMYPINASVLYKTCEKKHSQLFLIQILILIFFKPVNV